MGAHVYPETTVLVGQFTDPLSLAERPDDEAATSVVDHLVRHLEDLAAAHRIEYLKIMNAEFVCAVGFDDHPDHGVRVLADVALDLQERWYACSRTSTPAWSSVLALIQAWSSGSPVGRGEGSYNLWGEACARRNGWRKRVWRAVFRSRHRHTGVCVTATCSQCEARTTCRTWVSSRPTSSRGGYEPDAHGRCAGAMGTVCAAHVMQPLRHIGAWCIATWRGVTGAISIGVAVLLQACRPVTWRRTVRAEFVGTVPRWRSMGCRPSSSLDCWSG